MCFEGHWWSGIKVSANAGLVAPYSETECILEVESTEVPEVIAASIMLLCMLESTPQIPLQWKTSQILAVGAMSMTFALLLIGINTLK